MSIFITLPSSMAVDMTVVQGNLVLGRKPCYSTIHMTGTVQVMRFIYSNNRLEKNIHVYPW